MRSSIQSAVAAVLFTVASLDGARAAAPGGGAGPDLDAVVRHETRHELPSGVARVETWRDRLVRRGDMVWTERLGAAPHTAEAAGGHRHFDVDGAARLLTLDAQGAARLRFVDKARRLVVSMPKAEWETVGFDGRHDVAASLVPPALVARMPPDRSAAAAAAPPGSRWHVQHAGGWSHRVLWSAARQVALRIESRSDDGRSSRTVTLLPRSARAGAPAPWQAIDGYAQREYDDFMD